MTTIRNPSEFAKIPDGALLLTATDEVLLASVPRKGTRPDLARFGDDCWFRLEDESVIFPVVLVRTVPAGNDDQVAVDLGNECIRQDRKWGQQDHPSVDRILMERPGGCTPERMAQEYEIPTANRARAVCDAMAEQGGCTWAHIAVEELCEAIEAAVVGGDKQCRAELVQLTAVCFRWIESIDRRAAQS